MQREVFSLFKAYTSFQVDKQAQLALIYKISSAGYIALPGRAPGILQTYSLLSGYG